MTTNTDSIPTVPALRLPRLLPAVKARPAASTPRHVDLERERRERAWLREAHLTQGFMVR